MRRVLNILQSTSMAFDKVTEETVYTCVGHPLRSDIANIISWMLNEDFTAAYSKIRDLQTFKGLALQDILTEIHLYVHQSKHKSSYSFFFQTLSNRRQFFSRFTAKCPHRLA